MAYQVLARKYRPQRFADVVGARLGMCGVEYFAHPWEFGPRKAKALLLTGDAIDAEEALDRVIRGYALKTSNISTSPFRPAVSFTTLTTIYKIESLLKFSSLNSYYKMSYVRRKGI